jgi:hypothetical protein
MKIFTTTSYTRTKTEGNDSIAPEDILNISLLPSLPLNSIKKKQNSVCILTVTYRPTDLADNNHTYKVNQYISRIL